MSYWTVGRTSCNWKNFYLHKFWNIDVGRHHCCAEEEFSMQDIVCATYWNLYPFASFWTPAIMSVVLQVICLNVTLFSTLPTWIPCGSMFNVNRNPYYVIYFTHHYHLVSRNIWCSCFCEETTKLDGTASCI